MNHVNPAGALAVVTLAATLAVTASCGGEESLSPEQKRMQAATAVTALSAPGRSLGVEAFTDNNSLAELAPHAFPEVASLLTLGPAAAEPLIATFADPLLDVGEDGDRIRALAALVLEHNGVATAVPALRTYLTRALAMPVLPFFSVQTTTHAIAVLSGATTQVRSLYGYEAVQAVLTGMPTGASVVNTSKGTPILHEHLLGPTKPPAMWTEDFTPGIVTARNEIFTNKLDGIAQFEDPIMLLEDATRSYDCHSFTFRRDDTRLPDKFARYHILGESVPTILKDEGYTDITASPSLWKPGDVVVFYNKAGDVPTHTGRLSSGGKSIADPDLRFTSKWSVTLPVVNVSVRDCAKLYGTVVRIWTKLEQCAAEVRAASANTCVRRSDGTVWCWGLNMNGQLGNGTMTDSAAPVQVMGLTGAVSVAVGQGFACAAKNDGTVWCWGGQEFSGALGDGTEVNRPTPVQAVPATSAVQVVAGIGTTCARKADGTVVCWGIGFGKTGVTMVTAGPPPNEMPKNLIADEISAGYGGFGAHTADGALWGWSGGGFAFPGDRGSNWKAGESAFSSSIAYPVTSVMSDLFKPPTLLTGGVRAPVIGRLHACVLQAGGAVTCWGINQQGQLGRPTTELNFNYAGQVAPLGPAIEVAAGDNHTCARTQDGGVWCWGRAGDKESPMPTQIPDLVPVVEPAGFNMAAGDRHTCLTDPNGVWCWGSNLFGQLGAPVSVNSSEKPLRVPLPCPQ